MIVDTCLRLELLVLGSGPAGQKPTVYPKDSVGPEVPSRNRGVELSEHLLDLLPRSSCPLRQSGSGTMVGPYHRMIPPGHDEIGAPTARRGGHRNRTLRRQRCAIQEQVEGECRTEALGSSGIERAAEIVAPRTGAVDYRRGTEEDRSIRHPVVGHHSSHSSVFSEELLGGNPVERRRASGTCPA